jgi:chromosome segregation ATPase
MIAAEINALTASMLSSVIEIGRRMVEAKEMLPYGSFGQWIEENTGYSSSTANNFMRLFKEYGAAQGSLFGENVESQTIGKLSYSKALALLALPSEERESFVEENRVDEMSTKELKQAIRERDEARRAAEEARAERDAAEKSRAKMEEDVRSLKELQQHSQEAAEAKTEELERVEAELAALKEKPVDVAVEKVVDQEAIEKARQEAVTQMEEKVAKAKAEKEEAEAQRAELEEKLAAATEKLDAAQKQAKEASASSNQEIATFKLLFDQAQEAVNKMSGLVLKLDQAGRNEEAEKLRRALKALASAVDKAGDAE